MALLGATLLKLYWGCKGAQVVPQEVARLTLPPQNDKKTILVLYVYLLTFFYI